MQSTELETWKPVVGYEGLYEVSSHGRVWSSPRVVMRSNGSPQTVSGKFLTAHDFRGYRQLTLSRPDGRRLWFVHQLVVRAFVGPPAQGEEVCHGDGNRSNNHANNLRWGSRSDNMRDAVAHGTHKNAAKTHCTRGHQFTAANTRIVDRRGEEMRVCIACRKRQEPCPVCGEIRSYYGMKSHLLWGHQMKVEARSWQTAFPST